ncbi:MAG TPA: TonB-dependent receptor [Casimicrobiaceae bacterium]|nr:TonB-dependent receptor [Casimicrobiaceae bacterium]
MIHCFGRRAAALAGTLVACTGAAQAQTSTGATSLDRVVVTAARSPQPIADLIADVTVLTADDIAHAGVDSLAELLTRVPGVEIASNGGPATTGAIFLRGANSNHTLVLVDGLRVSSSSAGTTPVEAIPLSEIDHIEILRGPASSLYGSDAVGGVIQIFTRRGASAFSANATVGYGTYATGQATGGVSGAPGGLRYALQVGAQRSGGFNAIGNPDNFSYNPDRDGYRDDNASGSIAYRFAPDQELSAQFFHSRLNAQFDAGMPFFDDRTITTLDSYSIASRNRLASFWVSRLEAGEGDDDSVSQTSFGTSPFRTRQRQYTWQNDFALTSSQLSVIFERREEHLASDPPFSVTMRNTNAAGAVWQWRDGPNALQANLRHDDSSQFGGRTTGAIAYGYSFGGGVRASASYGTAFKAPTFNDLYYPGFSNPDLQPESSHNAEAALRYAGNGLSAGLVAYRNRVSNLIVFECDPSFNCVPQNVESATLEGVTFELEGRAAGVDMRGSLDLQRPLDNATGNLLPRRARRHGAITVARSWNALRVGAEVVASGARFDDAANTIRMGGYALVNLTAEYDLGAGWTLFARGTNVLDKHYELAADYNTAGAAIFAGVRYRY